MKPRVIAEMKIALPVLLTAPILFLSINAAFAQEPVTKTLTVTGNHVGPFNVNAHVQGPTQTQQMQQANANPQSMSNKSGTMNCPSALPPLPPSTPTPPVSSSPTSFSAPPGFVGFPVPPMGSQTKPDGTNISVFPGGTAVTTPPGGGTPIITPPGLGEDKTHGAVIARQVRPGGKVVQIYEDGHYSVTKDGATKFSTKPIW